MSALVPPPVVLGICPDTFWSDQHFHFIHAAAELQSGKWTQLRGPEAKYSPEGTFFASRELCNGLRSNAIAAWELEDQPNWIEDNLRTRYRAVRRADTPLEILRAAIDSDAVNVREYLTEIGCEAASLRADGLALIEFADGVVAKLKVQPHPSTLGLVVGILGPHPSSPGWTVAFAGEPSSFLECWPSLSTFQVIAFTLNGKLRRFSSVDVGRAPVLLDVGSWDEILQSATLSGGLGSYKGPSFSELKKARDKIFEILKSFPLGKGDARRKRIERLLSESEHGATVRQELSAYVASHPAFQKAVDAAVQQKDLELKKKHHEELIESEVAGRMAEKEREASDRTKELESEREQLSSEIEKLRETKAILENDRANTQPEQTTAAASTTLLWLSTGGETKLVKPEAVVSLIEKNLSALGIVPLSARNIGFEAVVAASIGQAIFFRGSLARPVAEAVGLSFSGLRVNRISLGLSDTLAIRVPTGERPEGLLLVGTNLACLDSYGEEVKRLVFRRRFSLSQPRLPVIIGTIEDGPSALPVHSGFFDLGPLLDTDVLPWKTPAKEPVISPGRLDPAALAVPDGEFERDSWTDLIKATSPTPGGIWPGTAATVIKRLTGLAPLVKGANVATSFLFGWILPRLLGAGLPLSDHRVAIKSALALANEPHDPRVVSLLATHKWEQET